MWGPEASRKGKAHAVRGIKAKERRKAFSRGSKRIGVP